MRFCAVAPAVACLVQLSSAFYPFEFPNTIPVPGLRPRVAAPAKAARGFSVPLRKIPVKRENLFHIVYANSPAQANSVGLNQDGNDYSYMISLQFGSTKKNMNVLLDSAAVNTWVVSSNCTTAVCAIHNTFGLEDSTSLQVCTQ
jgi:Eukaryotic aspartyl protease